MIIKIIFTYYYIYIENYKIIKITEISMYHEIITMIYHIFSNI